MIRSRLFPIMIKEFIHILRDPRSLGIVFVMPVMMVFLFGYAIDMDLKNVRLGVCDLSRSPASRDLVEKLDASTYFRIVSRFDDPSRTEDLFQKRLVRAVVVIHREFARELIRDQSVEIGVIVDGSDANSANMINSYLNGLLMSYSLSMRSGGSDLPVSVKSRIFYNPDMESAHFVVPGLVALVMIMAGALLTSVTIAREKETGTMEQILVSPIRPAEIVLGKVVPYLVLAFLIALNIILFGHFWFDVPFLGSWSWLMLFCTIYLFTALAIGLLISTIAATQQVAMMVSLMATMLPSVMLTGFIFPIPSMPMVLQVISQVIPATHFLVIIRGIMLKGNGPADLWPSVLALVAIGFFFTVVAIKRFQLKLS